MRGRFAGRGTAVKAHWRNGLYLLPVLAAGLALVGFGVVVAIDAGRAFRQVETINAKLDVTQDLLAAIARYDLGVAAVLYEGRVMQAPLREARLDMERGFVRLTQEARDQVAATGDAPEQQQLLTDVENARRMLELYHAIDLSAARALVLSRDGRSADALQVYRREVDFRLATELMTLLEDGITRDRQRLEAAHADWMQATTAKQGVGLALAVVLLLAAMASWLLLSRRRSDQQALAEAFETRAQELRDANRKLRETDARRAEFLADVSHELRTPLTILRGEADVALLPGSKPEDRQRSLERIQDQAGELAQLLDDLLTFARSEGEPQEVVLHRVLLNDVAATAVEEAEALAEPREVSIQLSPGDTPQWVSADIRRLKQALLIGLDNAINHSPPGSRIEVQVTRAGDRARVAILDQGPGLAENEEQRVFDRFYRGGSSLASGLGIGLAIARGIIEQHNGTIALANRAGGGAVLTIELPLAEVAA